MRLCNELLHKKNNCCLHPFHYVLDLCGSMFESHDDARFAYQGKCNELPSYHSYDGCAGNHHQQWLLGDAKLSIRSRCRMRELPDPGDDSRNRAGLWA